jgi:hypothetical protein
MQFIIVKLPFPANGGCLITWAWSRRVESWKPSYNSRFSHPRAQSLGNPAERVCVLWTLGLPWLCTQPIFPPLHLLSATLTFTSLLLYIHLSWSSNSPAIEKTWYVYIMECYSSIEKNEIMLFAGKWVELETVKLSKISQAQKDKYHMFYLICGI